MFDAEPRYESDRRPLSASELASAALRLAIRNYRALVTTAAVALVPTLAIGGGLVTHVLYEQAKGEHGSTITVLIGALIVEIGNLGAQAMSVHAATSAAVGATVNWRTSLRAVRRRLGAVVSNSLAVAVLSTIGLALFIVPGIYVFFTWFVVMPIVVFEAPSPTSPLRRSSALVRGRWWPIFGAFLLISLVVVLIAFVIGIVFHSAADSSSSGGVIVQEVVTGCSELLLAPFQIALVAVAYLDLRQYKEGKAPAQVAAEAGIISAGETAQESPFAQPTPSPSSYAPPSSQPTPVLDGPGDEGGRPVAAPEDRPPAWPAMSPKPEPPTHRREDGDEAGSSPAAGEHDDDAT